MTHLPNGIPQNLWGERGGSTSSQLSGLTALSASQSPPAHPPAHGVARQEELARSELIHPWMAIPVPLPASMSAGDAAEPWFALLELKNMG